MDNNPRENRKKTIEKNKLETYNLTHDNTNGFSLKFDDVNWTKNLNSLKPLVKNHPYNSI